MTTKRHRVTVDACTYERIQYLTKAFGMAHQELIDEAVTNLMAEWGYP